MTLRKREVASPYDIGVCGARFVRVRDGVVVVVVCVFGVVGVGGVVVVAEAEAVEASLPGCDTTTKRAEAEIGDQCDAPA
jgi:hypothetical protein